MHIPQSSFDLVSIKASLPSGDKKNMVSIALCVKQKRDGADISQYFIYDSPGPVRECSLEEVNLALKREGIYTRSLYFHK